MRLFGLLLLVLGIAGVIAGIRFVALGYWPWRFGEPFDLLAFGGALTWFGALILLRSRKHQPGVLLKDMTELEHFAGEAERQIAVDQVVDELRKEREGRPRVTVTVALLSCLLTIPLYIVLRRALMEVLPVVFAKTLAWGVVVVVLLAPTIISIRRSGPKLLRRKLLERGVPVCMNCGYILRGCRGPNCPECGTPFDKRVIALLAAARDAAR